VTVEAAASPRAAGDLVPLLHASTAMGGRLVLRTIARPGDEREAARDMRMTAGRVRTWAAMLTRRGDDSDLVRLNRDPRTDVPVGPTLAAALAWAAEASALTGGIVDPTLLDERLAAEARPGARAAARATDAGVHPLAARAVADPRWRLRDSSAGAAGCRCAVVERAPGTRFDLDGVAKGWLADRALALTARHPGAIVDADGDIALRLAPGEGVDIGVDDPRTDGWRLAVLRLTADGGRRRFGVATSGTSVHRWRGPDGESHHLIDPRTGRPALTDVVQATVIAGSARVAEALAKTAVVAGAAHGLDILDRLGATGAILLLDDGRVVALPRTSELLA